MLIVGVWVKTRALLIPGLYRKHRTLCHPRVHINASLISCVGYLQCSNVKISSVGTSILCSTVRVRLFSPEGELYWSGLFYGKKHGRNPQLLLFEEAKKPPKTPPPKKKNNNRRPKHPNNPESYGCFWRVGGVWPRGGQKEAELEAGRLEESGRETVERRNGVGGGRESINSPTDPIVT